MAQDKIVRLRKGKKGTLRQGHPWIFKTQIFKLTSSVRPGDKVTVISNEDKIIGRGYFNPASKIAVRLLTFNDEPIDGAFLHGRIASAVEKRAFLKGETNAGRLIFTEADSLPGLVADMYNDTLVLQILTLGMERLKGDILKAVREVIKPKFIYERSDSPFRKAEGLKPVKGWIGPEGNTNVEIAEGPAKFIVDIENGHKTGFYLDQRGSRRALRAISKGKSVLDLFCYTGGFSVHAALGGAKKVCGVDIKTAWLELARKNSGLNAADSVTEFIKGDAFGVLRNFCNSGERFDIIIVDPPSFAKDWRSVVMAVKGYKELNTLAMRSLSAGGVLCTFSCSHNISNEIFSKLLKECAAEAGKDIAILKRCRQDKDHPIVRSIPETEYLKGYFLKVS